MNEAIAHSPASFMKQANISRWCDCSRKSIFFILLSVAEAVVSTIQVVFALYHELPQIPFFSLSKLTDTDNIISFLFKKHSILPNCFHQSRCAYSMFILCF